MAIFSLVQNIRDFTIVKVFPLNDPISQGFNDLFFHRRKGHYLKKIIFIIISQALIKLKLLIQKLGYRIVTWIIRNMIAPLG
jgi:hypothetical protein